MWRWLTRMSSVICVLLVAYWIVAATFGANFRHLSGDVPVKSASMIIGVTEWSWQFSAYDYVFSIVRDDGRNLPQIGRYGFLETLLGRFRGVEFVDQSRTRIPFGAVNTLYGIGGDGAAMTFRWVHVQMAPVILASAVLPGIAIGRRVARVAKRQLRARRVMKQRRFRNRLSLCECGYDLRAAAQRCPECGRVVRTVRISLPARTKTVRRAEAA